MGRIVQVKLRESGRVQAYDCGEQDFPVGTEVIVEADRGEDYGMVITPPRARNGEEGGRPMSGVVRKTTEEDALAISRNREEAARAKDLCVRKIAERRLSMKLIEVECSFDRSRIIFYFTAEGRIDFRGLVRDLAGKLKTRIELRQIGVRDEARLLGGIGCCGRQLCCATFLKDFNAVNIRMAKSQQLPLNSSKVSGLCGRLLCCLRYEYESYKQYQKGMPRKGMRVSTSEGNGYVTDVDLLQRMVKVELKGGRVVNLPVDEIKRSGQRRFKR